MASYVLFVTGSYELSNRMFPFLKNVAAAINQSALNPVDFTVQCFDRDGRFARAFGGTINTKRADKRVDYNGWTTDNKTVKAEMARFERYFGA